MSYTQHTWVNGETVTADKLNNMEGGIKNNDTAITSSVGFTYQTFATNKAYAKGDYVLYDNQLYVFTEAHSAGAWTGTDVTNAVLANDVASLKSEINQDSIVLSQYLTLNYLQFLPGNFNSSTGQIVAHTKYDTAHFINDIDNGTITINLSNYKLSTYRRIIGSSDAWAQSAWAVTQTLKKGNEYYIVARENSQIDINQYADLISKSVILNFDSSLVTETEKISKYVDASDIIPLTGTNQIKADAKNVCTFSVDTLTIPSETAISSSPYIGEFFYAMDIQKLLGKIFRIRVNFAVSDAVKEYIYANIITNLSDVSVIEKRIDLSNNYAEYVVYIPSTTSVTDSKYLVADITLDTVTATTFNANQTIQITGVSVSDYYLDDIIDKKVINAVTKTHEFTDNVFVSVSNGATKTTDSTTGWDSLTIPTGSTGKNSMIGVKIDKKSNLILGKNFYVRFNLNATTNMFNYNVQVNSAASGSASLLWHINDTTGRHLFKVHCDDIQTLQWLIVVAQVNSDTERTSSVEIKVTSYEIYSEDAGSEQLAQMYFNHDTGKKLCAFGHSMTQMEYWQSTAMTDLGLDSCTNIAIYGGTLVYNYGGIVNTPADANIVTVWYDTNDWALSEPLGAITDDATTPTTFYGALKNVCEWLGSNRPFTKVLLISSPKRFDSIFETVNELGYQENNNGDTLEDFANAIGEVAKLYSYGFADLFHVSGINIGNASTWLTNDLLHPNVPCGIRLGHIIADAIRRI